MGTEKHGPRQRRHRHLFMFRTGGETGSWWQLEERGVPGNRLRKTFLSFLGAVWASRRTACPGSRMRCRVLGGLGPQHLCLSLLALPAAEV